MDTWVDQCHSSQTPVRSVSTPKKTIMETFTVNPDISGGNGNFIFDGGNLMLGGAGYNSFVWLNVYTFSHTPVIFVGMPSLRSVFGSQITTWFMPQCVMLSNKNSSVSVSQINVYQNFNGQSLGFESSGSSSLRILDGKLQYGTQNGDYNPSLTWWALLDPDQPIEAS